MRKASITISLLVTLIVTFTQLATAAWNDFEFTNETSGGVYVAFSTLRPASNDIPEGWRTVGWYHIKAGRSYTFHAQDDNPIYYLIHRAGDFIKPEEAVAFTSWMATKTFVIVNNQDPGFGFPLPPIYTNRNSMVPNDTFFKVEYRPRGEDRKVTVTRQGAVRVGPIVDDGGTTDLDGGDDTTDPPPPSSGIQLTITPSSGGTTLKQGTTRKLTVSVTKNREPLAGATVSLSVPREKATISPALGQTDRNGKLSTTLTIQKNATPGTFKVTAAIANTSHSVTLPITVEIGAGQLNISASPSTIEPGKTSRVMITARTSGGTPFPGAQISLAGGNISPTLVTTDANGQATATFRANSFGGAPRLGTSSSTIIATVVNNTQVKASTTLTVGYTLGSFFVSGVPSSITSGDSRTITVTVKSKRDTVLSGISVNIGETDDKEISFSSLRGTTNSSGQWSTTMYTGSKGPADFNVSVSGLSQKVYSLTVKPKIRTEYWNMNYKAGCRSKNNAWVRKTLERNSSGRIVDWRITNVKSTERPNKSGKITPDA